MDFEKVAYENMQALRHNPYPGRGIVIGASKNRRYLVQIYWIMGRSENSRNRIFSVEGGRIFTEAADPTKMNDPRLIIYDAMNERGNTFVVSNGAQTNDVLDRIEGRSSSNFQEALMGYAYEPDVPNFTPRITGLCSLKPHFDSDVELAVLRKSPGGYETCDRLFYGFSSIQPGFGYCVTTYAGNGDPLPAFHGEPLLVQLPNRVKTVVSTYWELLNEENRVALVVKFIHIESRSSRVHVINKYTKQAA